MKGEGMGREGREEVHNLRKTTPRYQMAGYGPADAVVNVAVSVSCRSSDTDETELVDPFIAWSLAECK